MVKTLKQSKFSGIISGFSLFRIFYY